MKRLRLLLSGILRALGVTLRNVWRRPMTLRYPDERRPLPRQWRGGSFALTLDPKTGEENCIGCRLCEYICPSQIIAVTLRKGEARQNGIGATYADHFTLDYQACMQCELCVQVCPTDAIVMTRALHPVCRDRDGLFLSKERLFENGRRLLAEPALESWATATRLREWTDVERGAARASEAAAPPTPDATS